MGVTDDCLARGQGASDGEDGDLVDDPWDLVAPDLDSLQRATVHLDRTDRLSLFLVKDLVEPGPHAGQAVQDASSCRVQPDVANPPARFFLGRRRHDPEGCAGDVTRDGEIPGLRGLPSPDGNGIVLANRLHEQVFQHPFGVIARQVGLGDGGAPLGMHPGKKNGAFHLGAGDR